MNLRETFLGQRYARQYVACLNAFPFEKQNVVVAATKLDFALLNTSLFEKQNRYAISNGISALLSFHLMHYKAMLH